MELILEFPLGVVVPDEMLGIVSTVLPVLSVMVTWVVMVELKVVVP